jgi:hypothetical protein
VHAFKDTPVWNARKNATIRIAFLDFNVNYEFADDFKRNESKAVSVRTCLKKMQQKT